MELSESPRIRRALISVSDKIGLTDFARGLADAGVEIFSTGGTRKHLENEKIPVRDISDYTGFPEMMDGRLKTLHPKVHGGILCRHDNNNDMKAMVEHGIQSFELVIVNLYPFEATVAKENVTEEEAISQIDIGGPTMVRAAAKNHKFVTIVTNPDQYSVVLEQIQTNGMTSLQLRRSLAKDAFTHTGAYDTAISKFFTERMEDGVFPENLTVSYHREAVLRYGENPHQQAALYVEKKPVCANVVKARQLNGKELSYNNLLDLDSALNIVRGIEKPAVAVLKHNNPCGAAVSEEISDALKKAMEGDPLSAFGSILGFNRTVDEASAEYLATPGLFVEAVVAPEFCPKALEILKTKPKWHANVRLLQAGKLDSKPSRWGMRMVEGGMLLQEADIEQDPEDQWQIVTEKKPEAAQMEDLRFAWEIVRHVKSNAITLCKDGMLLGAGAGQMSRVDSVEIAIKKAGGRISGSVMGSDAFFPFPDSIEAISQYGVTAVIQPGGSKNDAVVIDACNKSGIAMIFTGRRHFKH
ncbi:MAG: bifunctional phosphoribosylaminoimidazolecarboxamide formyltransferase/IMP cyclohydrolase [Planctomycetaceae bacterium]|jgi:phosphoribosylaminoimidazolecarboxamide formyltransferase/IMP cyclohydrolase|nr:bifunctional phosphoribosylaminoimidazolecarboxamide formyltransferase/IMP cyclohydrolase [Planctomycetaceae bacterium]